jgi:hypothetical protein
MNKKYQLVSESIYLTEMSNMEKNTYYVHSFDNKEFTVYYTDKNGNSSIQYGLDKKRCDKYIQNLKNKYNAQKA